MPDALELERHPADPTADGGPASGPPSDPAGLANVTYFVASHVNPEQVGRLVRACRSSGNPQSRVLIHHNYAVSHLDPALVQRHGNVDMLPEHSDIGWGKFAACEMVLEAMRYLLDHRAFEWVIYLSGQDYPIRPLSEIERELATTPYDGFIQAKPVDECSWHLGFGRYYYRYYEPPKFPGWASVRDYLRRRTQRQVREGHVRPRFNIPSERHGTFKVGVRPLRPPFNERFRCYFGSAWWTLNRRAVESMVRMARQRPDLIRHYRRALWATTESFFATLLFNDPSLNLCAANDKRFVSWTHPETGHPDMLSMDDWDRLMASDAHFARKIDGTKTPELLDRLDRHIGIA